VRNLGVAINRCRLNLESDRSLSEIIENEASVEGRFPTPDVLKNFANADLVSWLRIGTLGIKLQND
jgi:hypothetical protein